jgi:hypothetical protein
MSVAFEQQYKLPTGNISTSQGSVRVGLHSLLGEASYCH